MLIPLRPEKPTNVILVDIPQADSFAASCPKRLALIGLHQNMLTETMVNSLQPACIVLPLFAPEIDMPMLLGRLVQMRYSGRVVVLSPPLPDRQMVLQELRAQGWPLRIQLVFNPTLP